MPAGSYRFQVGSIRCTVLSDGYFSYPTPWVFPNLDQEQLSRAIETHRLPREFVLSPYTCLLIETGRRVVLVDTGGGSAAPASGAIVARLQMAGIPEVAAKSADELERNFERIALTYVRCVDNVKQFLRTLIFLI